MKSLIQASFLTEIRTGVNNHILLFYMDAITYQYPNHGAVLIRITRGLFDIILYLRLRRDK